MCAAWARASRPPSPRLARSLTAFLFPILLKQMGTPRLLHLLVVTSLLGALVTWWCRIETNGVNLETIGD